MDAPRSTEHPRRVDQRARRDREVVDDEGGAAVDVADEVDDLGRLGVIGPLLVSDGEGGAEPPGVELGLLGEAGVGRHDDQVGQRLRRDRLAQHRHGVQVVDRDAEEALHLRGVQVHGDDAVGAGGFDGIGADPGPDRHPRLVLLVALGVAEVRHQHGHRRGAGPLRARRSRRGARRSCRSPGTPCPGRGRRRAPARCRGPGRRGCPRRTAPSRPGTGGDRDRRRWPGPGAGWRTRPAGRSRRSRAEGSARAARRPQLRGRGDRLSSPRPRRRATGGRRCRPGRRR